MPKILVAPCLKWWKYITEAGYGIAHTEMGYVRAHRFVWEECFGVIPDGLHVLHHCDNPWCVAPDHLFLGTHQDNMKDRDAKGRTAKGETLRHNNAKLTWKEVRDVRRMRNLGMSLRMLAFMFGCSHRQIGNIVHGRHWREN